MSQFDFGTIDPNVKTGTQLAADLNQWRTALHSTHAGASRPAYAAPGMLWVDQASATDWQLKLATATGDALIGGVNPTTNISINRFPDGTLAAPGISWENDPDSGFRHVGGGAASYVVNAVAALGITGTQVVTGDAVQMVVKAGIVPALGSTSGMAIVIEPSITGTGVAPGIGFSFPTVSMWQLTARAGGGIWFGSAAGTGPTSMSGYSMGIAQTGDVYARNFVVSTTFVATSGDLMSGALQGLLKLRGVRYFNTETEREAIGLTLEDVERAFPELVSQMSMGETAAKGINYAALAAPIIEAIRELDARVKTLEAKPA